MLIVVIFVDRTIDVRCLQNDRIKLKVIDYMDENDVHMKKLKLEKLGTKG